MRKLSLAARAASLGLAKDTVGRAIRRLRYAGLVTVAQKRTDAGTFDTGTYLIAVPDCITVNAPTQSSRLPRARVERRDFSQLSLAIEP